MRREENLRAAAVETRTLSVSKHIKHIGVVSALTMVSRVLGLVRESLTAAVFGTSALLSAYFTGFLLPNLFRRLLAEGSLTAALVPALNEELKGGERERAFRLVNQVTSWLSLVVVALVAVAMLVLDQDAMVRGLGERLGAESDTIERWTLAAWFAVILFPYLMFVSLAAAFSAALQTLQRFVEPALSPVWLNVSMIAPLLAARWWWSGDEATQIQALCAGVLVGGFLQMAVPAAALMNEGWRPRADFELSPPVRGMLRLMGPTVFSSSIYLVNMSVSRLIGLSLNDEAVAVLNFSQRLMELPIGVFAVAISTVVFPLISRYAAMGDPSNLANAYRKGMRLILVINVPAAAGLAVLALPIIRVIFQHGAFESGATRTMTPVLIASAVGLPFFSFVNLALRAFYAQKDTKTPVKAAVLSFVINVVLSVALIKPLSTLGLAVASTIAIAVQAAYLQWHLARRQDGLAFHHLAGDLVKVVSASVAMAMVVAAGWSWGWTRLAPASKLTDAAGIAVLIVAGVAVYGGLVWGLKIKGREEMAALWAKVRSRPR